MALYAAKRLFLVTTYLRIVTSFSLTIDASSLYVWSEITVTPSLTLITSSTAWLLEANGYTSTQGSTTTFYMTPAPYATSTQILLQLDPSSDTSASTSKIVSLSVLPPPSTSQLASSFFSSPKPIASSTISQDPASKLDSSSSSSSLSSTSSSTSAALTPTIKSAPNASSSHVEIIAAIVSGVTVLAIAIGLCWWCNRRYKRKHGVSYSKKFNRENNDMQLRAMNLGNTNGGDEFKDAIGERKNYIYNSTTDTMKSTYALAAKHQSSSLRSPSPRRRISGITVSADEFYNTKLETHNPGSYGMTSDTTEFGPYSRRSLEIGKYLPVGPPPLSLSPAPLNIRKAEKTENTESVWVDDTRHSVTSNYDRNTIPGTEYFNNRVADPQNRSAPQHQDDQVGDAYAQQGRADAAARLEGRDPIAERSQRELEKSRHGRNLI